MGEARSRGTYAERKKAAITRDKTIAKAYKEGYDSLTRAQLSRIRNRYPFLTKAQKAEIDKMSKEEE